MIITRRNWETTITPITSYGPMVTYDIFTVTAPSSIDQKIAGFVNIFLGVVRAKSEAIPSGFYSCSDTAVGENLISSGLGKWTSQSNLCILARCSWPCPSPWLAKTGNPASLRRSFRRFNKLVGLVWRNKVQRTCHLDWLAWTSYRYV